MTNWDTMMIDDMQNDEALDALFKATRDSPVAQRPAFVARLIADADASVSARAAVSSPKTTSHWTRRTQNWLAASGLTAATVFGLCIGLLLPESQLADTWLSSDAIDVDLATFLPGTDLSLFTDPETDG